MFIAGCHYFTQDGRSAALLARAFFQNVGDNFVCRFVETDISAVFAVVFFVFIYADYADVIAVCKRVYYDGCVESEMVVTAAFEFYDEQTLFPVFCHEIAVCDKLVNVALRADEVVVAEYIKERSHLSAAYGADGKGFAFARHGKKVVVARVRALQIVRITCQMNDVFPVRTRFFVYVVGIGLRDEIRLAANEFH